MYLHLGVDYMVKNSEIIAIFNLNHPQSVVYDDFVKKYGSIRLSMLPVAKAITAAF